MINHIYQRIKETLSELPLMTWVLSGFFITFIFFFIGPVFFDPSRNMQFNQYIAVLSPIGHDFKATVSASSALFNHGEFVPIIYPAFTMIFYSPFTLLSLDAAYALMLWITLLCYILITVVLPQLINRSKSITPFVMLIFVTGLVSYGFQFELERGQSNILAFTFCLLAIYLFHNHPRRRWLAYLLFSISVQLKLYPAIFVFALIEDWSAWKDNIKRFVGLGVINIAALFIFGLGPLQTTFGFFSSAQSTLIGRPYNLSIRSFATDILSSDLLPHLPVFLWLEANNGVLQFLLLAFFLLCFGIILWQAYKKTSKGMDQCVFMACLLGAFIIPTLSFDYKLSILPAAVAISIPALFSFKQGKNRFQNALLAFIFSLAYSSTLYSYRIKPEIIKNDLPALLVILAIVTILSCARSGEISELPSASPTVKLEDQ